MPNPSDILGGLPREIIDTINGTATARPKPSEILGGYHKELIDALGGLAHLDSPALTGTPTAPTADAGDESAQIATTEFVQQEITANPAHLELMSPTTIGGAKLGDGLTITDGALGIDPEPQESTGAESPVAIQVARGRNLLRMPYVDDAKTSQNGLTFAVLDDGGIQIDGTASATTYWNFATTGSKAYEVDAGTYTISVQGLAQEISFVTNVNVNGTNKYSKTLGADGSQTVDYEEGGVLRSYLQISSGSTVHTVVYPQLELGSTPTPYVPYGHVGIDVTHDGTTTTIPVPLPSKGYAAALPDGTADVLTIDGAGKVEWASAVARIESYAGESVGAVYLSTTGSLTTGAEVYYPLATPVTEQVGYIDWPTIPDGATITCPELDALGVRYLIGNGVAEMARDWYERGHAEAQANATALGELAQSVLDVDGKADAVAAQLVAEDVSSAFIFIRNGALPIADDTGRCVAYKALGFVWFNLEFSVAADTTLSNEIVLAYSDDATVSPHSTSNTNVIATQTNIPKVKTHILYGSYGPTFYVVPQESSVTVAGGNEVYSISGIYYVG